MKSNSNLHAVLNYLMLVGLLLGASTANAQSKAVRPPVAGDGKFYALIDSDWFGVIVDTGNFWTVSPYNDIARVLPHAVSWQVKEQLHNGDQIDLKRLIQIIHAGGYRGYLPIETLARKDKPYDPLVAVPKFLNKVRQAIKTVQKEA